MASRTKRARPAEKSADTEWSSLEYHVGFGNHFASEALPRALPKGQNNPQVAPYGLYAEQISGTAFTVPRVRNFRSWLYRIRPGVIMSAQTPYKQAGGGLVSDPSHLKLDPTQMRWGPIPHAAATEEVDFVDSLRTQGGSGDPTSGDGLAIHVYACNKSMTDRAMQNSDGDFLIVPQEGTLRVTTEFGKLEVAPREIFVVQRGIRFKVEIDGPSRGYILEVYGRHFTLPDLGPIGSNGLANARDFKFPVASYVDDETPVTIINKFGGQLFAGVRKCSVFDVVAWHGNYAPFKYNLELFCCMNSVTFDHPDPSIYTVLTCASESPGTAVADFVIFPPRWMVMEHSFRPPWYHRNVMTEYMGMIYGKYDAKVGFVPGGSSLHSAMTPHGPDDATFRGASNAKLEPEKFDSGLAFMFETKFMLKLSDWALTGPHRDLDYVDCWQGLPKVFDPTTRDVKVPTKASAARPANGGAGGGAGAGAHK